MTARRSGKQRLRAASAAPEAETLEQALSRARGHARSALAETLLAAGALLDAAALATSGRSAEAHASLGALRRGLDDLSSRLDHEREAPLRMVEAILDALDSEIARWEARSKADDDARAVLRAFLGLREILWEFGLRRGENAASATTREQHATRATKASAPPKPKSAKSARAPARVQRVQVQG